MPEFRVSVPEFPAILLHALVNCWKVPKIIRPDEAQWRMLLRTRGVQRTWHFTPLVCVPCILFHGGILSINEQERRGLRVPQRESRDDDLRKGVGNAVKLSVYPYWKMLSSIMREGNPEAMLEFTTEPILWEDTTFGNSNVWENVWQRGASFDFASTKVFTKRSQWDSSSPPEIYVECELPIAGRLQKIYTVLDEERAELKSALERLRIRSVDVFTAGFSNPFPNAPREEYLKKHPKKFASVKNYLRNVSCENLRRGVEIA